MLSSRTTVTAVKMDKSFDFVPFLNQWQNALQELKPITSNTISDTQYKKGLLKSVIMAGNGLFEITDSNYGFSIKQQSPVTLGPDYANLANGVIITHSPASRLPKQAIDTVIGWYRKITLDNGQEAQVNFYHVPKGTTQITDDNGVVHVLKDIPGVHFWSDDIFSYTPLQQNNAAHTAVDDTDDFYELFNRHYGMFIETHSHNSMASFMSGTDEANSKNDGLQLVFGRLDTNTIEMHSWLTMRQVIKDGLTPQELAHFVELEHAVTSGDRYHIDVENIQPLESLYDAWDKQVVVRRVVSYNHFNNFYTGYRPEFDDFGWDAETYYNQTYIHRNKPKAVAAPKTPRTPRRGLYSAYSPNDEEITLYEHIAAEIEPYYEDAEAFLEDVVLDAFVAGYLTKLKYPKMSDFTVDNILEYATQQVKQLIGVRDIETIEHGDAFFDDDTF